MLMEPVYVRCGKGTASVIYVVMISSAAICRHLRESLQWVVVKTRCGPMISDANKQKRLEFAKMCLENQDNFDNIIWTDESTVQLKRHC